MEVAETNVVVLVTPALDVPGQWVAHCLNIDLVTQGDSIAHAFMMAQEALMEVIVDDLAQGLDPLSRPAAEQECWDKVRDTLQQGKPLAAVDDQSRIVAAVGQLQVVVPRDALPEHARPAPPEVKLVPPAWQIAALQTLRDSAYC